MNALSSITCRSPSVCISWGCILMEHGLHHFIFTLSHMCLSSLTYTGYICWIVFRSSSVQWRTLFICFQPHLHTEQYGISRCWGIPVLEYICSKERDRELSAFLCGLHVRRNKKLKLTYNACAELAVPLGNTCGWDQRASMSIPSTRALLTGFSGTPMIPPWVYIFPLYTLVGRNNEKGLCLIKQSEETRLRACLWMFHICLHREYKRDQKGRV
jgi:hypothetical protein